MPEGQQMVKRGRRAGAAGGGEEQGGGLGGEEVLPNDGMQMDMPLDGGADWYAYDGMQQQYDGENIELERYLTENAFKFFFFPINNRL